jgi:hypothetical protein
MVSHEEFVKEIRAEIDSLGLLTLKMPRYLAKGFNPDLLVMCGINEGDRVFVEAINTRGSLNRDIGSLLKLKANLDSKGIKYRRIIALCSERIRSGDLKDAYALEMTQPQFLLLRIWQLKSHLREVIIEAMLEKLDQLDKEELEHLQDPCPLCGERYNIVTLYKQETQTKSRCEQCGVEWIKQKT